MNHDLFTIVWDLFPPEERSRRNVYTIAEQLRKQTVMFNFYLGPESPCIEAPQPLGKKLLQFLGYREFT